MADDSDDKAKAEQVKRWRDAIDQARSKPKPVSEPTGIAEIEKPGSKRSIREILDEEALDGDSKPPSDPTPK